MFHLNGKRFKLKNKRHQYSLSQADAMTFHKARGLTLKRLNMNFISPRTVEGLHYTGISRVETISNIVFTNSLAIDMVKCNSEVEEYMHFLQSTRPVNLLSAPLSATNNMGNIRIEFYNI